LGYEGLVSAAKHDPAASRWSGGRSSAELRDHSLLRQASNLRPPG
jgi:hypothetical protein